MNPSDLSGHTGHMVLLYFISPFILKTQVPLPQANLTSYFFICSGYKKSLAVNVLDVLIGPDDSTKSSSGVPLYQPYCLHLSLVDVGGVKGGVGFEINICLNICL